jgi:hypothetical protein
MITYSLYDDKSFIIYSNKTETLETFFDNIDGYWSSLNDNYGFVTSLNENKVKKIVEYLNIINNGKSRKDQNKYRRSESESDSDSSSSEIIVKKHISSPKNKYKKYPSNICSSSFTSKNPPTIDLDILLSSKNKSSLDDDDDLSYLSSSSYNSSSSDGFPSPATPKKRNDVNDIADTVQILEKRIKYLETKLSKK